MQRRPAQVRINNQYAIAALRKDGREVLAEIKADEKLKRIPVVILTTSQAEEDILKAYNLNANCYISKPVDLHQFLKVVRCIEDFWLTIVKLPSE